MIKLDRENRLFTLHTRHTTYQMKADEYGVLLHTYYGPRIDGEDLSYLICYADRGFSPNPSQLGFRRDYSLDTLPQEYSTCGVGDYRLPSIQVELADGSHLVDLRCTGFELREGKYALEGLPAFHGDGGETLVLFLEDPVSRLTVELYYGVFEDYDLITRAVRVVNGGDQPVKLLQAASLCLDFLPAGLDLITFDGRHMMERCPNRGPLLPGVRSVSSCRGSSSHQHNPFVILCSRDAGEDTGLCYGAALLYSGNFQAAAERDQFENSRLVMGIDPCHFCYTLAPGDRFTTPEAAVICSGQGFGHMSRQFHRAIRERLIRDNRARRRKRVLINNWEATYYDFNAEKLLQIAREAAQLGVELFVMDDGWFGTRNSDLSGLGDWYVNREKLPGGLEALVPRIQALGMEFGIWAEPEMVSEDSRLYREHPDWVLGAPGRPPARGRAQLVLDFSRQEVRDHVYAQLEQVFRAASVTYLKWDMNRNLSDVWSAALPAHRQGEVFHRYVLGVYDFLERLRREHPEILVEGCSGGGGRFDAGMLYYTPQIWCSDNTDAIDRLRIQYGTSFCYPVGTMGAHVSASPNEQTGRRVPLETRAVVAMSGTFGYEMDLGRATGEEKEAIARQIRQYHQLWELLEEGDYYRLTDPFRDGAYTAWEQVSPDRREALVSIVAGPVHPGAPFLALRLKGLDPSARYRVEGDGRCFTGRALMEAGWPLPLPTEDYQSFQLHLRAEEPGGIPADH